jgi:hypothetical protein
MEIGREYTAKLFDLAERGTLALEKLAEEPTIEISGGPPECPHCGRLNPQVVILDNAGSGPLGDFVLHAHCGHCNGTFFGMVTGWTMFQNQQELNDAMEGAGENGKNG